MRQVVLFSLLLLLSGCDDLVEESYATAGLKSINGIDGFLHTAKAAGRKVIRTAYLSEEAQKADVIIHFEREPYPEHVYTQIESWMSGYEPEDMEPGQTVSRQVEPALLKHRGKNHPRFFAPGGQNSVEDEEDAPAEDEAGDESTAETEPETIEKQNVFVYFVRDTDASIEFWTRFVRQMEGHPEQKAYAEGQLELRRTSIDAAPEELPCLFGTRMLPGGQKMPKNARRLFSDEFDAPDNFEYRYLQLALPELSVDAPFHFRTLLDGDGQDLIREFYLNRGRLILVYNASPFLNWAMARPEKSRFAKDFLDYVLRDVPQDGKIAFIEKLPVPPAVQKDEEQNPFRLFTVFPLSVIFFQLLVFLAVFLLARSTVGSPLRAEKPHGSRDFTEHFKALGNLLSKGKLE